MHGSGGVGINYTSRLASYCHIPFFASNSCGISMDDLALRGHERYAVKLCTVGNINEMLNPEVGRLLITLSLGVENWSQTQR